MTNVVLARILAREDFGVVAVGWVVLRGLMMLSELGLEPAVVRSPETSRRFYDTAWTIQFFRGCIVWFLSIAVAFPFAAFFGDLQVAYVTLGLSFVAVIDGSKSMSLAVLRRELRERPLAVIGMARAVVRSAVMIGVALAWPSPFALVLGALAGEILTCVASYLVGGATFPRITLDRRAVHYLVTFGIWVFLGSVIVLFGRQLDKVLLGKIEGLGMLGVYAVALTVARIPAESVGNLIDRIYFPIVSRWIREDNRWIERVRDCRGPILSIGAFAVVVTVACAPPFFWLLYEPQFYDAAWIAPLLGAVAWIDTMNFGVNKVLMAAGRVRGLAFSGFAKVVVIAGCGPPLLVAFGVPGLAGSMFLGGLIEHIIDLRLLAKQGSRLASVDLLHTAKLLVLIGLVGLGYWLALAYSATAVGVLVIVVVVLRSAFTAARGAREFVERF